MLKFVVLLSVIACVWGATVPEGLLPQLDGRIIGGTATSIDAFPWQVSLQRRGSHSCGGSIYSPTIIVTAAHCLQRVQASDLKIRAGSSYKNSGGVLIAVDWFKNHEGYNAVKMVNDIAIMHLKSPLKLSSTIKTIDLASTTPEDGAPAAVSGWGTTQFGQSSSPAQLQYVNLEIVSLAECSSDKYDYGYEITSTMVCAKADGKDACQGDSGGPLVSNGELVGVVSWGYGCARPNYPGVYADVADFYDWVIEAASSVQI